MVGSPAIIGPAHASEDVVLHDELELDLVQPIAAALRRGPIDVVRTGAIADGTVDITGADLHLRAPAMRLLLLPFGADESAKPRESGVKAEKRR